MVAAAKLPQVLLELTNNCNYRCVSCPQSIWQSPDFLYSPFDRPRGFMDFDLYGEIVEELFFSAEEINFSYFGEPMMHPQFLDCMSLLKKRPKGMRIVMNSNMSYATAEIFEKFIEIGLDDLRISLDAACEKTYEIVRPGNYCVDLQGNAQKGKRFKTICEKIAYWHNLKDHSSTRHVYTVGSRNSHEIYDFIATWQKHLSDKDVILFKNILTYGGKMHDPLIKKRPCNNWDFGLLTVDWSGRVSACHLDTNMELQVGHISKDRILDIKSSEPYKDIRKASLKRAITPCDTCIDSNYWDNTVRIFKDSPIPANIDHIFL